MRRPAKRSARPLIVCFAGDVWEGRPHSRHYLMQRLAGGYEVLFVEGAFVRSMARLDRREWRQLVRKLRGFSLRTVEPHLHVLRPLPIPPAGRLGRLLWLVMLAVQIRLATRWLKLTGERIAWFSLPTVAPLAGRLGEQASLFYYQDRYHEFPHVDEAKLRADIQALAQHCDACVASAGALAEDLRELGADPVVVRHGVDLSRFSGTPDVPRDLATMERPLVGYVGRVGEHLWKEAVVAVADRLERGTVVLVGDSSTDLSTLRHPRVKLLGRRPSDSMPAYVGAFDCCLIPFVRDRLTEAVNPIKLREYLAAGRPVVATSLPEVIPYADVLSLADSPSEFADAVTRSVGNPDSDTADARARRRARVAGDSWDAAASRVAELLGRLLVPKPVDVGGCMVDRLDMRQTVARCEELIASSGVAQHVSINAAKVVAMRGDAELRTIVENCELVSADGQSVVWASRLLGDPLPERVAGIDLMDELLALSERRGYRVYFLGARDDVLGAALETVRERHPALFVAGTRDGYFAEADSAAVAEEVRAADADILFVAMPSPRKEYWLAEHGRRIGVPFVMGVGGSVDVLAGRTRRAPVLLQRLGLEWAYRLAQEPRRLLRRYLVTNVAFCAIVLRQRFGRRRCG